MKYLVAREEMNWVKRLGWRLASVKWFGQNCAWGTVVGGIAYGGTIIFGVIFACTKMFADHPEDFHTSWPYITLMLTWLIPIVGVVIGSIAYGRYHALAIPNQHIRVEVTGGDGFHRSEDLHSRIIESGADAYFNSMPAILQEGAAAVYDRMYVALARYHIANEPEALQAAAKRGKLLLEIAGEGAMTRAAQLDISDEKDLREGREIVEEMKMMRREIES